MQGCRWGLSGLVICLLVRNIWGFVCLYLLSNRQMLIAKIEPIWKWMTKEQWGRQQPLVFQYRACVIDSDPVAVSGGPPFSMWCLNNFVEQLLSGCLVRSPAQTHHLHIPVQCSAVIHKWISQSNWHENSDMKIISAKSDSWSCQDFKLFDERWLWP